MSATGKKRYIRFEFWDGEVWALSVEALARVRTEQLSRFGNYNRETMTDAIVHSTDLTLAQLFFDRVDLEEFENQFVRVSVAPKRTIYDRFRANELRRTTVEELDLDEDAAERA